MTTEPDAAPGDRAERHRASLERRLHLALRDLGLDPPGVRPRLGLDATGVTIGPLPEALFERLLDDLDRLGRLRPIQLPAALVDAVLGGRFAGDGDDGSGDAGNDADPAWPGHL